MEERLPVSFEDEDEDEDDFMDEDEEEGGWGMQLFLPGGANTYWLAIHRYDAAARFWKQCSM